MELAGALLTGLTGLGLLSSHSTTFHRAATICLGKLVSRPSSKKGLGSSPDKPAFTTEAKAGWA